MEIRGPGTGGEIAHTHTRTHKYMDLLRLRTTANYNRPCLLLFFFAAVGKVTSLERARARKQRKHPRVPLLVRGAVPNLTHNGGASCVELASAAADVPAFPPRKPFDHHHKRAL